jgi:uncharacterized UBP type Zn finger protein
MGNFLSRFRKTDPGCTHLGAAGDAAPRSDGCEECLASGGRWVHLRACLECGHVGCCDQSDGRHANGHFKETGHPVIRSAEPGETWCYCWVDYVQIDPEAA